MSSKKNITYEVLYDSLTNKDKFSENLYGFLKTIPYQKKFKNKINNLSVNVYDGDLEETVSNIYLMFLEKKIEQIFAIKFDNFKYFASYFINILNSTVSELNNQNDEYNIKNRIAKEIRIIEKKSTHIKIENDYLLIIKRIDNPKLIKKPNNLLGISNKNLLDLIMIIVYENKIYFKKLINKAYDYLVTNGFIIITNTEEFIEDTDENENSGKSTQKADDDNTDILLINANIQKAAKEIIETFTKNDIKVFITVLIEEKSKTEAANILNMSNANITYILKCITSKIQNAYLKYELDNSPETMKKLLDAIYYFLNKSQKSV